MLLATRQDVDDRMNGNLPDETDVAVLLDEASVMVQEWLRRDYATGDTIPRAVAIVTSRMVARRVIADMDGAMEDVPDGVSQLAAAEFQASFTEPLVSQGVWLNRTDKMMLRRHRVSMKSIPVVSDRTPYVS